LGTDVRPIHIGRLLDDGTTQWYQYEYESQTGHLTRETDPLGRTTTYTNAPNGIDLLEVRRVNGQTTDLLQSFTYNAQHRPLTVTDAAGQTTTYTYNAAGQLLTVVTPPRSGLTLAQRTTTYAYDTYGRLESVTGPAAGATMTYSYDGYGRLRTVMDSEGYGVITDYDALDRVTKVTFPDGTHEETVYNRLDAEKQRDRLGRWTRTFFFDALRRPVAVRDPLGRTTTYQWCNCGTLNNLIDPNGNATTWERDLQARVTRVVRPNGSAKEFTYETTTSRLKKIKDAKDQETQYSYFLDDKLQQVAYVNPQLPTPNVTFAYDTLGRISTMSDGTGTTTYGYNPITPTPSLGAGLLASVDGPLANDTVTYTHEELGRVVGRALNSMTSTWSYDALGRIQSQTSPLGTFGLTYIGITDRLPERQLSQRRGHDIRLLPEHGGQAAARDPPQEAGRRDAGAFQLWLRRDRQHHGLDAAERGGSGQRLRLWLRRRRPARVGRLPNDGPDADAPEALRLYLRPRREQDGRADRRRDHGR
jgi:YD repeat-containing protein